MLASHPSSLADTVLIKYPKYLAWRNAVSEVEAEGITISPKPDEDISPKESIANGYTILTANLAAVVRGTGPDFSRGRTGSSRSPHFWWSGPRQ